MEKDLTEKLVRMLLKDKEGEKLIKESLKSIDKHNLNSDCEIHITKKDMSVHTDIKGIGLTVLLTLKCIMDKVQEDLGISDKEFKALLEATTMLKEDVNND